MSVTLSRELYTVLSDAIGSPDEARKLARTAQVEQAYQIAVEQVFKNAAQLVLKHTNAVYCFEEKGAMQFAVYADDSSIRSSLDARQELLKIALLKQGVSFSKFKALPAQKSIKTRHPFAHATLSFAPPRPLRDLTEEELREVDAFVSSIEDSGVRNALREAVISDLRAKNTTN